MDSTKAWMALALRSLRSDLASLSDTEVLRVANTARMCGRNALADEACRELEARAEATSPGGVA